jgi:hypothetical protein
MNTRPEECVRIGSVITAHQSRIQHLVMAFTTRWPVFLVLLWIVSTIVNTTGCMYVCAIRTVPLLCW